MIYMNKEHGYIMLLIQANSRFFSFETLQLEMAKFTAAPGVDARDLLKRDFEFIGKL